MIITHAADRTNIILEDVQILVNFDEVVVKDLTINHDKDYYIDEDGIISDSTDDFNSRYQITHNLLSDAYAEADDYITIRGNILVNDLLELNRRGKESDSDLLCFIFTVYE